MALLDPRVPILVPILDPVFSEVHFRTSKVTGAVSLAFPFMRHGAVCIRVLVPYCLIGFCYNNYEFSDQNVAEIAKKHVI